MFVCVDKGDILNGCGYNKFCKSLSRFLSERRCDQDHKPNY